MIKIGLIDSYAIIRLGLTLLLNENFDSIEFLESDNVLEFKSLHGDRQYDVLILGNNSLIAKECFDAVVSLKTHFPHVPVIVYDENIKQNLTVRYFELKIDGYISKQNIASEIVNAINAVLNKKQFICPATLTSLLSFMAKKDIDQTEAKILTKRESEIALYLSQGMKTSWIANTLGRKPSTISTIKNTIFKKMKVDNVVELKTLFGLRDVEYSVR